jgi:hypothetical protein
MKYWISLRHLFYVPLFLTNFIFLSCFIYERFVSRDLYIIPRLKNATRTLFGFYIIFHYRVPTPIVKLHKLRWAILLPSNAAPFLWISDTISARSEDVWCWLQGLPMFMYFNQLSPLILQFKSVLFHFDI